jgi:hypothetical protein
MSYNCLLIKHYNSTDKNSLCVYRSIAGWGNIVMAFDKLSLVARAI